VSQYQYPPYIYPNDKSKGHVFDLYFDFTIYRVVMCVMAKDYELDLRDGEFASLIGYEKKIFYLENETNTGEMIPNITRDMDWVLFIVI